MADKINPADPEMTVLSPRRKREERVAASVVLGGVAVAALVVVLGVTVFAWQAGGIGPIQLTPQAASRSLDTRRDWVEVFAAPFNGTEEENAFWAFGEFATAEGSVKARAENGVLRLETLASDSVIWWQIPEFVPGDEFLFTVSGQRLDGPADAGFGSIFWRTDDENYYTLMITDAREVYVLQRSRGSWITHVYEQEHRAVQVNRPNTFAVSGNEDRVDLFINSQWIITLEAEHNHNNQIGVVANLFEAGTTGAYSFDDFIVRQPDKASPAIEE